MERMYPIIRKTEFGDRAFPISKSDLDRMLAAGTAEHVESDVFREIEVEEEKHTYETRDMTAQPRTRRRRNRKPQTSDE